MWFRRIFKLIGMLVTMHHLRFIDKEINNANSSLAFSLSADLAELPVWKYLCYIKGLENTNW